MDLNTNRRALTRMERGAIARTFERAVDTPVDSIIDSIVLPRVSLSSKAAGIVVGMCDMEGVYNARVEREAGKSYLRKGYEDVLSFLYPHIAPKNNDIEQFVMPESTIAAIAALSQRSTDEVNMLLRFSGSKEIHSYDEHGELIPLSQAGESGHACPYGALPPKMSKPLFKEFCKHTGALLIASREASVVNISALPKVVYNLSHA